MASTNPRIKVAGYSQKVVYNDNIEYRNFMPDLAGLSLVSSGGTSLFTMGNFVVTTNYTSKVSKTFSTNKFSNFVSLTDLNTTLESSLDLLLNNSTVSLNLDATDLTNYALFGSLTELVRVSLENIIMTWPAALYVNPVYAIPPIYTTQSGHTIENYVYDSVKGQASFKVNVNTITNQYQLNFLKNAISGGTTVSNNPLTIIANNYQLYAILYGGQEYDILGFTGSTRTINDYLYFIVQGNVFSATTNNGFLPYYIKPNTTQENLFYNSLPNFEYYLLNRFSNPKFTSTFKYTVKSDTGNVLSVTDTLTWPISDGYNLDFDTVQYANYATKLSGICSNYDLTTSSLMTRFLVSNSITDFDTTEAHVDPLDQDTSDQKMLKTLNIYGRGYDDINTFIKGVSFAHAVSYDKNDNTPDVYLKDFARNLGWDLISSVLELDLLKNYVLPNQVSYSGHTVGLTAEQADNELWRRLILNTPWLWRSKGTRKSVEFLFKFIGTPLGLISFNEYVYVAQNQIDMNIFSAALTLNNANTDLTTYPISLSGYPAPLLNTPDLYYQSNGLWYRETGGANSSIDITTGNNPHLGPYDGGFQYINQFRSLIPNFSAITISSQTTSTSSVNLFNNYNGGTMTSYSGNTYVDVTNDDGMDFSNCVVVTSSIILDPADRQDITNCGCVTPTDSRCLSVCFNSKIVNLTCQDEIASSTINPQYGYYMFNFNQYNLDGSIYEVNASPVYYSSYFVDKNCCNFNGSVPYFYNELDSSGNLYNNGYICCQTTNSCGCFITCSWTLDSSQYITNPQDGKKYLVFDNETGGTTTTSFDGCNCISTLTTPTQITDPITGNQGYGCQLTQAGLADLASKNSLIVSTYNQRASGTIGCNTTACILGLTTSFVGSSNNAANGSITLTPDNGTGPYNYSWTNGTTTESLTNITSTYVISNLIGGTYTVSVSDSTACSAQATINVPALNCGLKVTVTTVNTSNKTTGTGSVTANVSGAIGSYTVLWVNPNNFIGSSPEVVGTTNTINNLYANTYQVTVTDSAGCTQTVKTVVSGPDCSYLTLDVTSTINSATAVVGGVLGVSASVAIGGTTTYPNLTYLWNNGATTQTISNLGSGTYNVTVTDTNTGCQIKGSVVIESYTLSLVSPIPCNTLGNSTYTLGGLTVGESVTVLAQYNGRLIPPASSFRPMKAELSLTQGTTTDMVSSPIYTDGSIHYVNLRALITFVANSTSVTLTTYAAAFSIDDLQTNAMTLSINVNGLNAIGCVGNSS